MNPHTGIHELEEEEEEFLDLVVLKMAREESLLFGPPGRLNKKVNK